MKFFTRKTWGASGPGLGLFGLIGGGDRWALHIGIPRRGWLWGVQRDWYDGPLWFVGLGPLFTWCYA